MKQIIYFLFVFLWRNDSQYGFIGWRLAWELAGIFTRFDDELSQWELLEES